MIHPSAIVADDAVLPDATVGAFCVLGVDGDGPALVLGACAIVRSHSVIYRGVTIGVGFQTGHGVLIRHATAFGNHVSIGSHSVIEHSVTALDGVRVHSNCFIPELSILREGAWIGPGVVVTNARFPNRPDTKDKLEGVSIGRNAVVGAGVILLPGVSIGDDAIIGAGAVVVRDVAAGSTVVGNPARQTR